MAVINLLRAFALVVRELYIGEVSEWLPW